jgi:DNA-binding transcriptional ArsR family regulator
MPNEIRRQISDPKILRALADPIRYRILTLLMAVGPRTASQCAEVVGATPSNCSYHLRELARYGLVERMPERVGAGNDAAAAARSDGRERPWRPTVTGLTQEIPPDSSVDKVGALAHRQLLHVGIDDDAALAHTAVDRHDELPADWQAAETMATFGLRVTPKELETLGAKIDALLRPYIGLTRDDPPTEARNVHVAFRAFRRPDDR